MVKRILIVDDDPGMAAAMSGVLARKGCAVDTAADGREALGKIGSRDYPVLITDLRMPGMDGNELVRQVHGIHPSTRIIVVTAHGTVASAVDCVRNGAVEYLQKPFSPDALAAAVEAAFQENGNAGSCDPAGDSEEIVAVDPATLASLQMARKAALTDATILLEAESGAGKEVFARLIHRESARRKGPFVAVNCAALPRELLEAELFGHSKGAFTGAVRERRGHFQAAGGGTLFLDEIGEMSTDLQGRLLRVLQDHIVQPIGSETAVRIDVRVVAATNKNLREQVSLGKFREDLYYRLRVVPIRIPPLRERPGDIEPLVRRFLARFGGNEEAINPHAMEMLLCHRWPGNVRELQNCIQRAMILAGGGELLPAHIDLEPGFREREPEPGRPSSVRTLEDAERETVRRTLVRTGGNRSKAAEALGISPRTLRHKLKQWRDAGKPVAVPAGG